MDPLAALLAELLSEQPPQQLSASELRSRIALLEDAASAYRAELESRTAGRLDALPDEIQQVIFGQLCSALDPRDAVAYSSASKGLRELMQQVGVTKNFTHHGGDVHPAIIHSPRTSVTSLLGSSPRARHSVHVQRREVVAVESQRLSLRQI